MQISKLVPLVKDFPFFRERGLKENAISDMLRLLTFKNLRKNDMVIEYGTTGDEFYLILEGECEVMVPDEGSTDSFKKLN